MDFNDGKHEKEIRECADHSGGERLINNLDDKTHLDLVKCFVRHST